MLTNPLVLCQLHKEIGAIVRRRTIRRLIEATRRADAARQMYGEQVFALVDPAAKLVKWLVAIKRDHVGA